MKLKLSKKIFCLILIITIFFVSIPSIYAQLKMVSQQVVKLIINPVSQKPINILLLGSDSRTESFEGRSDAVMILNINPLKNKVSLVSFPRDARIYFPGRSSNKINAAVVFGGPELAVGAVENYSRLDIDYYALTSFQRFISMINDFGGIQINVEKPIRDRAAGPSIEAGNQTLNGLKALAMARSRKAVAGGDFGRAANHQKLLVALFKQEKSKLSSSQLMDILHKIVLNVKTNMSLKDIFVTGLALSKVDPSQISQTVLEGRTGMVGGASSVILDDSKAQQIFSELK